MTKCKAEYSNKLLHSTYGLKIEWMTDGEMEWTVVK